ncbi:tRNA lysidine(34) synthetase TilS [Idiomarina seosinensis]|uniref:tRNA lysidine(34) synthetase TilS n=1 Tax=Idiomarina seosinensis TaxID=281739 RepID=UPI00384AF154
MSDLLYQRFRSVLQSLSLKPQQQIVIALGGGADSQTILDCAMRYRQQHPGHRYLAVHLDHSFHPDSAAWSQTIEKAAQVYGIETLFEPLAVATEGQSKEAAGRERRYQRLQQLSDDDAVILLGQHRNDQIETFLLQLNRGSGPKGLSAMAEVRDWHQQRRLVRPLLSISKDDIYRYAEQHQLVWIEDETNYDTRIERNFLRHEVVPLLEQRWPQFGDSVLRSARLCAEQQQVLEQLLDRQLQQQLIEHPLLGNGLSVDSLRYQDEMLQRVSLRRWLEQSMTPGDRLPSYQQLEQIRLQALQSRADSQATIDCTNYQVRLYQMALWRTQPEQPLQNPLKPTAAGWFTLPAPWGKVYLNEALIAGHPVEISSESPPGRLQHIKRQGRKTILDWLKQAGVPAWLRRSAPMVKVGDELLWLPIVGWLHVSAQAPVSLAALQPVEPLWSGAVD